ncbi:MAG: hypothetical protein ACPGJV_05815 [Bacteriovoracaceae bacterium]
MRVLVLGLLLGVVASCGDADRVQPEPAKKNTTVKVNKDKKSVYDLAKDQLNPLTVCIAKDEKITLPIVINQDDEETLSFWYFTTLGKKIQISTDVEGVDMLVIKEVENNKLTLSAEKIHNLYDESEVTTDDGEVMDYRAVSENNFKTELTINKNELSGSLIEVHEAFYYMTNEERPETPEVREVDTIELSDCTVF